jgi:ParB/RepB/Spo0J family partition protein
MTKETKSVAMTDAQTNVPLESISVSETNKMFRDESDFTPEALKELADSILEHGLIAPVTIRPGKKEGKYELVAGERRYRACKLAGLVSISCVIRTLTDEQALDIQLTENVQRKDIHPMREAKAYQFLQETKKWSTAELAVRFAKGETYILQRLRLITLIPEASKDFSAGAMNLAQALVIARLQEADQKEVVKNCSDSIDKKKYYESVAQLEDYIADNITRELAKAPFDTKATDLVPKVGSCDSCQKRSGAQSKLFADVVERDRCFDSVCFMIKRTAGIFLKVKELVESKPDTIFLEAHARQKEDGVTPAIRAFLSENKVTVLAPHSYNSYASEWENMTKRITGFVLNGSDGGHTKQVYVKGDKNAKKTSGSDKPSEMTATDRKEAIARIKERTKRSAELDSEKIYKKVLDLTVTNKSWVDDRNVKPGEVRKHSLFRGIIAAVLLDAAHFEIKDKLRKALKLSSSVKGEKNAEANMKILSSLSEADLSWIARQVAIKNYSSEWNHDTTQGLLIQAAAREVGIPVDTIVKEQGVERAKREERSKQRIAALNEPAKAKKKKK